VARTLAEQEVTFRWDQEECVLWAGTTTPWVAAKWTRHGHPVRVLSQERDGTPCSWEVKLPWMGSRRAWSAVFQHALPSSSRATLTATSTDSSAGDDPEATPTPANASAAAKSVAE
jgi:hypothetical protein